jgi:hypothetical protein
MATNNAIDAPLPLTVSNGGSGRATGTTAYGTLCAGTTATGVQQTVAPGTTGTVLTSNGASALPSYQAVAGSPTGLTWLGTATAAGSATVSFPNLLSATYDNYLVVIENLAPSTTSVGFNMIIGTGATPTYQNTNYMSATQYTSTTNVFTGSSIITTACQIISLTAGTALATTPQSAGVLNLYSVNSGNNFVMNGVLSFPRPAQSTSGSSICTAQWAGGGTAVTSIQFSSVSGNITIGTFKLYGYTN